MSRYKLLSIATLITIFLFAANVAKSSNSIHHNGKDWVIGYTNSNNDYKITEFIPKGENIRDWNEMITQETYPMELLDSPKTYMNKILQSIQNESSVTVHHKLITLTKNSIIFEWWISTGRQAQHEWYKMIKHSKNTTYVLRYTTKNTSPAENERNKKYWENYLRTWNKPNYA